MKVLTLCVIQQGERVLLGMKKTGYGAGRWNGFGGKVEPGETAAEAAVREVREECGVEALDCRELGVITFTDRALPYPMRVHVYRATAFRGEPVETAEMRPRWFGINEVPFEQMWPDDRHWFPLLLAECPFTASFTIGLDGAIESMSVQALASAPA